MRVAGRDAGAVSLCKRAASRVKQNSLHVYIYIGGIQEVYLFYYSKYVLSSSVGLRTAERF